MAKSYSKRFKLFKSVHITFCVVIVNAVFWVGLGFLFLQKSDDQQPQEKGRDYSIINI
jgi:hypothetical protein